MPWPRALTNTLICPQGMYSDDSLSANRDRLSYPCRYCGKRFTQTGTCRRHERLHTAPNGFKCPFCQKGFNRKYRLKEHIISAHPNNVEESEISMIVNSAASTVAWDSGVMSSNKNAARSAGGSNKSSGGSKDRSNTSTRVSLLSMASLLTGYRGGSSGSSSGPSLGHQLNFSLLSDNLLPKLGLEQSALATHDWTHYVRKTHS